MQQMQQIKSLLKKKMEIHEYFSYVIHNICFIGEE